MGSEASSDLFIALSGVLLPEGMDHFEILPGVTVRRTHGAFFAAYIASFAPPRVEPPPERADTTVGRIQRLEDGATPGPWHAVKAPNTHVDFEAVLHLEDQPGPFPSPEGFAVGWRLLALLRIATGHPVFAPLVTARPFDILNVGTEWRTSDVRALEVRRWYPPANQIDRQSLERVASLASRTIELFDDERFETFVGLFDDAMMQESRAGIVARAWAAIESLYSEPGETTMKLSLRVATLLNPEGGEARQSTFALVRRVYRRRSDVLHGRKKHSGGDDARDALELARRIAERLIELGRVVDAGYLDEHALIPWELSPSRDSPT